MFPTLYQDTHDAPFRVLPKDAFLLALLSSLAPRSPQALVTTDAVKLSPIGMLTVDHIGSTVVGLLAGIAP